MLWRIKRIYFMKKAITIFEFLTVLFLLGLIIFIVNNGTKVETKISYVNKPIEEFIHFSIGNDINDVKSEVEKARQLQKEKERVLAIKSYQKEKKLEAIKKNNIKKNSAKTYYMKISHYSQYCNGCTGVTAAGINIRNSIYYQGMRVIAADTSIIPLWSIVEMHLPTGVQKAIVLDRGGAIKGNKIDLLVSSTKEAYKLGVYRNVKLVVIRNGKG